VSYFTTRICSGILCGLFIITGMARAEKIPPAENLLPKSTQGFIAVTNVDALIEHFDNTELGKLTSDPVMKPFTEDVKRQFESRWSNVYDRLGVTLDDLREVPGGEVGIGLIEPAKKKAALAITIDITGHHKEARAMLENIDKKLLADGAKRTELKDANFSEPIVEYLLPLKEEEQEAEGSKFEGKSGTSQGAGVLPAPDAPNARHAFYFTRGDFLCTSDNLAVMHGILARLAGKGSLEDTLAEVQGFKMVAKRCAADAGDVVPQFRWFLHPIGYAAVARAATPPDQWKRGKSVLELMQNQGFDAIKGVGGFASFADESFDLVHRTVVYAPQPYEKSMKMLKFENGTDYTPQDFVPREIATYTTLYFDVLNAFDNFGPLFDELLGGGESGAWIDMLENLKTDRKGPMIDLRGELVEHLDHRISIITDYQMPITTSSERILICIQVKKGKDEALAKAIEKAMKNDPNSKKREENGQVIWEIVEQEGPAAEEPTIELSDVEPTVNPPKKSILNRKEEHFFPHAAITVRNGQLFVASHLDFLLKIMKPYEERELLRNDADYKLVNEVIEKMSPNDKCARVFSRTDEEYHTTYELIRQNKLPESESLLNRVLNQLFGEGKKGKPRPQKLDGSQLPEYDTVRRYLNPAGFQATAEEEGWFLKGFTLSKEHMKGDASKESTPKEDDNSVPSQPPSPKEPALEEGRESPKPVDPQGEAAPSKVEPQELPKDAAKAKTDGEEKEEEQEKNP
jgi:hypothetical protein